MARLPEGLGVARAQDLLTPAQGYQVSGAVDARSLRACRPACVGQGRPYVGLDDQTARSATAAPVCGESHIMPLPA